MQIWPAKSETMSRERFLKISLVCRKWPAKPKVLFLEGSQKLGQKNKEKM